MSEAGSPGSNESAMSTKAAWIDPVGGNEEHITKEMRDSIKKKEGKLKRLIQEIETRTVRRTFIMEVASVNAGWLRTWIFVLALLTMYLSISIPMVLAFGSPPVMSVSWLILLAANCIAELVFIADIVINFHITFIDSSGVESDNPILIRARYMRSWFAVDVLATLPLDMGLTTVGMLLRLLKLLRVPSLLSRMKSLEAGAGFISSFARVISLGFPLFLVFHLTACFWYSLGLMQSFGSTDFMPSTEIEQLPLMHKYLFSLHWALAMLASATIPTGPPVTVLETVFALIGMTAGLGAISYVVGAISARIEQQNVDRQVHQNQMKEVVKFLRFNEVQRDLSKRTISYLVYKWTANRDGDHEQMFSTLPKYSNIQLTSAIALKVIRACPMFQLFSEGATNAILQVLGQRRYVPLEYIYKTGSKSETMFFVRFGDIEAISHTSDFDFCKNDETNDQNTHGVEHMTAPASFGIFETLVLLEYNVSVRAATFVEVYTLDKSDMIRALQTFPLDQITLREQIAYNRDHETAIANSIKLRSAPGDSKQLSSGQRRASAILRKFNREVSNAAESPLDGEKNQRIIESVMRNMGVKPVATSGRVYRSTMAVGGSKQSGSVPVRRPRIRFTLSNAAAMPTRQQRKSVWFSSSKEFISSYVIMPNSRYVRTWKSCILALNLYNAVAIPFRIVFLSSFTNTWIYTLDLTGDILYIMDIVLNFHLAFVRHGHIITIPSEIQSAYTEGSFYRHLFASLPLDIVCLITEFNVAVRLPRMLRAFDAFNDLTSRSSNPSNDDDSPIESLTTRVTTLLFKFLCQAHFIACAYFLFTYFDGYNDDHDQAWLPPSYLQYSDDPFRKYFYSLYFAYDILLRLGNDITPQSAPQIIFTIAVLLTGLLVVAQMIGSFSSFLLDYNRNESAFRQRMTQLNRYLHAHRVPKDLSQTIVESFTFQWNDLSGVNMNTALDHLPEQFRHSIMISLCDSVMCKFAEFRACPRPFRDAISTRAFKLISISKNQVVYDIGEPADGLYFVRRGQIQLFSLSFEKLTSSGIATQGIFFGESCILGSESVRADRAVTTKNSHMWFLSRSRFEEIRDEFTTGNDEPKFTWPPVIQKDEQCISTTRITETTGTAGD